MAKTLREMFPREKTLYTATSVDKLIADYVEAGGQVLQMQEGTLGCGDVLLYDEAGKLYTFVIREIAINEWSSGHTVRKYRKIPAKYQALVDAA